MNVTITQLTGRHMAARKGLAELDKFLEDHPGLPLAPDGYDNPFLIYITKGTDEENRAEVDKLAEIMGVEAGFARGSQSQYAAVARFSGGVSYQVYAIGSRHKPADLRPLASVSGAAA